MLLKGYRLPLFHFVPRMVLYYALVNVWLRNSLEVLRGLVHYIAAFLPVVPTCRNYRGLLLVLRLIKHLTVRGRDSILPVRWLDDFKWLSASTYHSEVRITVLVSLERGCTCHL